MGEVIEILIVSYIMGYPVHATRLGHDQVTLSFKLCYSNVILYSNNHL